MMRRKKRAQRGQSIVEFVIFIPVLLVLLAGVVEIGGIINAKLTVVNSAREGTRFGVVGASDVDITASAQAATSGQFAYREENADIYVIHAKTGGDTSIADSCPANRDDAESFWCVNHTLGDGPESPGFVTRQQVEDELNGADIEALGVAAVYDHEAILGLPFVDFLVGTIPIHSFTVMRVETGGEGSTGCAVYPMAVRTDVVNWPDGYPTGHQMPDILIGGGSGNFGWLSWNGDVNTPTLEDNLTNPNNSTSDYTNSRDANDHELNVGDWIWGLTGWVDAAKEEVNALQDQYIRIVVFDTSEGTGSNVEYHVAGYVVVQINGELSPSDKTLRAKFIRFDTSCQ